MPKTSDLRVINLTESRHVLTAPGADDKSPRSHHVVPVGRLPHTVPAEFSDAVATLTESGGGSKGQPGPALSLV